MCFALVAPISEAPIYQCPILQFTAIFSSVICPCNLATNNLAVSRKNQQNDCAPSEDSDQPGHPPSLISLHCALTG